MGKKSHCISPALALPLSQYTSINQEKTLNSWLLPWKGNRQVECTSNIPAFGRTAWKKIGYYVTWLSTKGEMAYSGCLWATENKRELSSFPFGTVVPEKLQYHRHQMNKRWQAPEKENNKPNCEITCTNPEKTHSQKRIKRPTTELLAWIIRESLSLSEASPQGLGEETGTF